MTKGMPRQPQPKAFDLLASLAAFAQREGVALNESKEDNLGFRMCSP